MKKTYKLALLIITILLLVSINVFFSYNNYLKSLNDDKTLVLSNDYLSINYLNGNIYDYDEFLTNEEIIKKVSITNITDENYNFTLSIMDINNIGDLSIKVLDKENKTIYNNKLKNIDTDLIKNKEIKSKETLTYTIIIKNIGNPIEFSADLLTYREYTKRIEDSFKDTILRDNTLSTIQTTLGDISTINEGLISSKDELGDTYYFRGNVNNNYVKINNMLFRIVRINGDNTIRLVLDDVIDSSKYVKSINSSNYLNNSILSNSYIKEVLDIWYNNNLINYDNYIATSNFCYDNNFYLQSEEEDLTNSYERIYVSNTPKLECTDGIDVLKIGLLTIDEVIYAGGSKDFNNTNYYLYNENINNSWWTMSTSKIVSRNNIVNNFIINSDSSIDYLGKLTNEYYIRPVISLNKDVKVTGNGTIEEPYEIVS